MESRSLPVPEGRAGERADAAIARILGFSRTFAAEVIDAGGATLDGRTLAKSDRLVAGGWLEVSWTPTSEPSIVPTLVPGFAIVVVKDGLITRDEPVMDKRDALQEQLQ